jgi:hypothetical protein
MAEPRRDSALILTGYPVESLRLSVAVVRASLVWAAANAPLFTAWAARFALSGEEPDPVAAGVFLAMTPASIADLALKLTPASAAADVTPEPPPVEGDEPAEPALADQRQATGILLAVMDRALAADADPADRAEATRRLFQLFAEATSGPGTAGRVMAVLAVMAADGVVACNGGDVTAARDALAAQAITLAADP